MTVTIEDTPAEQRNCLSREVREGLFAAWDRFEKDPALRVAILTGAGDRASVRAAISRRWSRPG